MNATTITSAQPFVPAQSGAAEGPVDAAVALETELEQYRQAMRVLADVCHAASAGDLEPRVRHLGEQDELVRVRQALNHMLDLTDAFVREAGASLEYASNGRFFRRVRRTFR